MTEAPPLQPSLEQTATPSKYFGAKALADFKRVLDQMGVAYHRHDGKAL